MGEVVSRLKSIGSKVYSTAESGDIVVTTDGKTYSVSANEWTGGTTKPTIPSEPTKPTEPTSSDVNITSVDLDKEIVTIKNNGKSDVDMTGFELVSVEGNQTYSFPSSYVLKVGAIVYVTSGRNVQDNPPTYLKWTGYLE